MSRVFLGNRRRLGQAEPVPADLDKDIEAMRNDPKKLVLWLDAYELAEALIFDGKIETPKGTYGIVGPYAALMAQYNATFNAAHSIVAGAEDQSWAGDLRTVMNAGITAYQGKLTSGYRQLFTQTRRMRSAAKKVVDILTGPQYGLTIEWQIYSDSNGISQVQDQVIGPGVSKTGASSIDITMLYTSLDPETLKPISGKQLFDLGQKLNEEARNVFGDAIPIANLGAVLAILIVFAIIAAAVVIGIGVHEWITLSALQATETAADARLEAARKFYSGEFAAGRITKPQYDAGIAGADVQHQKSLDEIAAIRKNMNDIWGAVASGLQTALVVVGIGVAAAIVLGYAIPALFKGSGPATV